MSKATLLAESLGAHWCNTTALITSEEELEAFYHAARAEALREAAEECETLSTEYSRKAYAGGSLTQPPVELMAIAAAISRLPSKIRAMADREGK